MKWLIPIMILFMGCAQKPFYKVVTIPNLTICIVEDPTQYRPFPKEGVRYLGFFMLDSDIIYVQGYRQSDGRIAPDYRILGHELSCLMRHRDPEIETLFREKVLGN